MKATFIESSGAFKGSIFKYHLPCAFLFPFGFSFIVAYAYMPDSDDTRDTFTQAYIEQIQPHVKDIRIHDPFVADYRGDVLDVVRGADATVILVKHTAYTQLDWRAMGEAMGQPVFVDARQVLPADFTAPQAIIRLIGQGTSHQQEGIRYDD